jgi:hypothetical protein
VNTLELTNLKICRLEAMLEAVYPSEEGTIAVEVAANRQYFSW